MEGACRSGSLLSFGQALGVVGAVTVASGLWLYALSRRLAPGAARLVAAAPLVVLNLWLPLGLFCRWEECTTILLVAFNNSWIASFKALSWALDRGALCMAPFSLQQFLAVYAAPITPSVNGGGGGGSAAAAAKARAAAAAHARRNGGGGGGGLPRRGSQGRLGEDAGGPGAMLAQWAAKNVFVLMMIYLLGLELPGLVESFVCGLALYALLSLVMDGPAALAIGATGLRVSPHFDRPWRSTSVASFWSKRWDLAAGNTLRQLVYDVVVEGSLLPRPGAAATPARQALGTAATFTASGLIHEGIFWYITGRTTGGVWLAFFFVQAPLIVAERLALGVLKRRGVLLPDWLRTAVTTLLVVGTGQYLFWPPAKLHGVVECTVGNTRATAVALWRRMGVSLPI